MEAANFAGAVWGVSDNSVIILFLPVRELEGFGPTIPCLVVNDHLYVGFPLADTTAGGFCSVPKSRTIDFHRCLFIIPSKPTNILKERLLMIPFQPK